MFSQSGCKGTHFIWNGQIFWQKSSKNVSFPVPNPLIAASILKKVENIGHFLAHYI